MMAYNISERQLEDWICEHPESVMDDFKVIGRQIALPHGILDLLGTNGMAIYVIELKAGPIKEAHVGQVLRYAHDVNDFISDLWAGLLYYAIDDADPPDVSADILDFFKRVEQGPRTLRMQLFHEHICPDDETIPHCRPMLIGTSIDTNTKAALEGAGGWLGLWHYDESEQKIVIDCHIGGEYTARRMTFPRWAEDTVRENLLGIIWAVDYFEFDSVISESLFNRTISTATDE